MRIFPLLAVLIAPNLANAALIIMAEEVGEDVLVNASGTLGVLALSFSFSGSGAGTILPSAGVVYLGPSFVGFEQYTGISGPVLFGNGTGPGFPTTGSGGLVGVDGNNGILRVPSSYTSGDSISAEMTYTMHGALGRRRTTLHDHSAFHLEHGRRNWIPVSGRLGGL